MGYTFQTSPGVLILMVRHAPTGLNNPSNPKLRAWEDVVLTAQGQLKAHATASKLRFYKPQYIFSSDLMRDTETAHILAARLGISGVETDYNARTWDVGTLSGQSEKDTRPVIKDLYRRTSTYPPGSGESFDDFSRRWLEFLDRKMHFASIDGMRPSIIVTHGRNLALSDSHFNLKLPYDGLMPFPAGFAVLSIAPDRSVQFEIQGETEPIEQDV